MIGVTVGQRVKKVRRGCTPNYGTVVELLRYDDEGRAQWCRVQWDHGPLTMDTDRQLTPVQRDRRPHNLK